MMEVQSPGEFASFTLKPSTYVQTAVAGSFSGPDVEEIAVIRGTSIVEFACLGQDGTLETQCVKKAFSTIRSIQTFRPVGLSKDLLLVGSDSGIVTLLEFQKDRSAIKTVAELSCGKAGCRRDVPGQYVAADPSGRAIMAASVDGHKIIATVIVDDNGGVTVKKPAKFKCKMGTGSRGKPAVVYSVVGLEVGTEQPSFAVLAANDGAGDQELEDPQDKAVTVYGLDIAKNEVQQLWRLPASQTGALLAPVPLSDNSSNRPVFVLSENWVAYKDKDWREIRAPLPRRSGLPSSRGVLPVSWTPARSGGREEPWALLVQSEYGDLYAVTLEEGGGEEPPGLSVVVVDSLTRCSCLVSLHGGKVLWAVAECGDQMVYGMGELVGQGVKGVSASAVDDKDASGRLRDHSTDAAKVAPVFEPLEQPAHLQEVASVNNMAPITSLRSVGGRLVAFCGGGRGSSMRVFTSGLPVAAEEAGKLPTRPMGMWTAEVGQVQYLVVAFESSTSVWRMVQKEGVVHFQTVTSEECVDIGFVTDARTIEVGALGDPLGMYIQVLEDYRFVQLCKGESLQPTFIGGRRRIGKAAMGNNCIVLDCGGTELWCWRATGPSSVLEKYQPHDLGIDISAVAVSNTIDSDPVVFAAGLDLSLYALGYNSFGAESQLYVRAHIKLPAYAECLYQLRDGTLLVGLVSGLLMRVRLVGEGVKSELVVGRSTQVGPGHMKFFHVRAAGDDAILALSGSSSLLIYSYSGRTYEHTLAYHATIDLATSFHTREKPDCVLALGVGESTLRVLQIEGFGAPFSEQCLGLSGTPRGVASLNAGGGTELLVVLESDDGGSAGVRVVDPLTCVTRQRIQLCQGDVPLCVTAPRFKTYEYAAASPFVCVGGTSVGLSGGGWIDVYAVTEHGLKWQFRTHVDTYPVTALCGVSEQNMLLAAIGSGVRVYDYSPKKLLQRCEVKVGPSDGSGVVAPITRLCAQGSLVLASHVLRGVYCLRLQPSDSTVSVVLKDPIPRLVTDLCLYTREREQQPHCRVALGADKLGGLFMLPLPSVQAWASSAADPLQEPGAIGDLGATVEYNVGEVVTAVTPIKLGAQNSRQAVAYATVTGCIGVLVPLDSNESDVFRTVEVALCKQADLFPTRRDHWLYRAGPRPSRNVVDLDLCEEAGVARRGEAARDGKVDKKDLERRLAEILSQVSQLVA